MAKHDRDPALRALVRSVNDAGQASVPVKVSVGGSILHGRLVAEQRYFAELAERHPMMAALDPAAELGGERYAKDIDEESGYHLHLIGGRAPGGGTGDGELWRIRLNAVDGWTLAASDDDEDDRHGKGTFAGVLGAR